MFVLSASLVSEATACASIDASSDVRVCSNALSSSTSDEEEAPCQKLSKMDACFIRLNKRSSSSKTHQQPTVEMQLESFLRDEGQHGLDAVAFWQHKNDSSLKYPALKSLTMRVLCVPATSAPVERVFSQGSIIVRPHRNRLSPEKIQALMFLKCNDHIFDASDLM